MLQAAEYKFTIRNIEVNIHSRLSFTALANMLQECASRHAAALGLSSLNLMEVGQTWVLSRLKINLVGSAALGERLTIRTWPEGGDGLRAFRGFRIFNEKRDQIGTAASVWLIIDIQKRKVVSLPDDILKLRVQEEEMDYNFEKSIPDIDKATYQYQSKAGWHDLDINRHVNNNHFIKWIVESFPYEFLCTHHMIGLDMVFKSECFFNDEIKSLTSAQSEDVYIHQLLKSETLELGRAVSTWRKLQ